jgi:hypothetical protein
MATTPASRSGVASGTVMGPQRHLTGAFTVLIYGHARHAADQRVAEQQHQLRRAHASYPARST